MHQALPVDGGNRGTRGSEEGDQRDMYVQSKDGECNDEQIEVLPPNVERLGRCER